MQRFQKWTLVLYFIIIISNSAGELAFASNESAGNSTDIRCEMIESKRYEIDGKLYISEHLRFPAAINNKRIMLEMSILRPDDGSQYPVIILTHGRNGRHPQRDPDTYKYFEKVYKRFAKENLIVAYVIRRGFGLSDGSEMDEYKATPYESGMEMTKDIAQALLYLKSQPYAIKDKFVIAGHSQGGWAALSAASANLDGVVCIMNFSGATNYINAPRGIGWQRGANRDMKNDCHILGKAATMPSLWIYGEDEQNRTIDEITKMFSAYIKAGADSQLILLPGIRHDTMSRMAQPLWEKPVHEFLIKNNIIKEK